MALARIKKNHHQTTVAFGKSGLPLGHRDDIDQLAIIALESKDQRLMSLFEYLPSLEELKKQKVDKELSRIREKLNAGLAPAPEAEEVRLLNKQVKRTKIAKQRPK